MDNSGKLVLGYWPIRGLAERIRLALEYTGLQYEQVFYYEHDEDKWFKEDKPKHLEKNPAANLPYLIDGEKIISESTAIIVHACHKANRQDLLGRNAEEQVALATVFGVTRISSPISPNSLTLPTPTTLGKTPWKPLPKVPMVSSRSSAASWERRNTFAEG